MVRVSVLITSTRSRLGGSLVEVMIAVTVGAALAAGVAAILIHCLSGWSNGAGAAYAENGGDLALQRLLREISDAKSAAVVNGVLTVTFPIVRQDPTTGEKFYDRDSNGEVRDYYMSSGVLYRRVGNSVRVVARNLASCSFGVTGRSVAISLATREQVGAECVTRQFSGQVALRNMRSDL